MPAGLADSGIRTSSPVKTNYVLIDFESVQTKSFEQLIHEHFKVIVFVGATQDKLTYEVVESLQQLGSRAEYIKISGRGPNALDFHIAYYIGRLAAAEPHQGDLQPPEFPARLVAGWQQAGVHVDPGRQRRDLRDES